MTSVRTKVVTPLITIGKVFNAADASASSVHSSTKMAPE